MKKLALVPLGLLACSVFAGPNPNSSSSARPPSAELAKAFGNLPLTFESNEGQADPSVKFLARGAGYSLLLTKSEAFLALEQQGKDKPDKGEEFLAKLDAKTRKRFEASKIYRMSPLFRKARKTHVVAIAIDGGNADAKLEPLDETPTKSNYFIGNDRSRWYTGIPNYARVRYSDIYPGVDLIYYGNHGQFEFDFVVSPGADPRKIALRVPGQEHLGVTRDGALRLGGDILLRRPSIYQAKDGKKYPVEGGFVLLADGRIGVRIGVYDHTQPLTIDPILAYSTLVTGSSGSDAGAIAVDSNGNAYIVGSTPSTDFPIVSGYQSVLYNWSAYVAKLNPTGTQLLYSTFLSGTGESYGLGVAIDGSGSAYATGYTFATDFPVVNGFQTTNNNPTNGNAFVARIDTTQTGTASLIYSTYLGGGGNASGAIFGDLGVAIATDGSGKAYVTGLTSSDTSVAPFPTTTDAYQSSLNSQSGNAFFTTIDTSQSGASSLVYSTYLGGDGQAAFLFADTGLGIALGKPVFGIPTVYIVGQTTSGGSVPFPTTTNAYQSSLNSPNGNAFLSEFFGSSLVYSTYFGGSTTNYIGDIAEAVGIDSVGGVYVAGDAMSPDFPTTSGAFQTANSAAGRGFIAKFDLTQTGQQALVYSTFLGGSGGAGGGDGVTGVALDANGNAFLSGWTYSSDYPVTSGAFQSSSNAQYTGTLSELNPQGSALLYATYLGGSCGEEAMGIALDSSVNPYLAGYTCSSDFPTSTNAFQTILFGYQDAFVTKFSFPVQTPVISSLSPGSGISGTQITLAGSNFGLRQGSSTVTFGGVAATIDSWSSTSVVAEVASNAAPGPVQVVLTTSVGSSSGVSFTVVPSISGLLPAAAPVGASVAINGANFGSSTGAVTINGATASIVTWSSSQVVAVVPATTSGNVIVTANSTPSNATNFTVAPAAVVSGISVNSGTAGTSVTITGTSFGASQGSENGIVVVNGATAQITSWSDTSVVAQVPSSAAPGQGSLQVNLSGSQSNAFTFTVIPSLNVTQSPAAGDGFAVISGADLGSSQGAVSFNGMSPQILSWSATAVTVQVPSSLSAGVYPVSITAGGMTTNTVNDTVSPAASTISPAAAQVGATVTISGTALGISGSLNFNGVSAAVASWSNTSVTTQVPSGATTGPVVLTTNGVQASGIYFQVLPPPSALSSVTIEPATATLAVGETRTLLAIDNNGNTITGASWSVDNTGLASISMDTPPLLTTVGTGTITLTATYQGVSGQATWNIVSGSLANGTPQWTFPDSLNVQQVVNAVPSPGGGADLFVIEQAADSSSYAVRGIALDGSPLWISQVPFRPYPMNAMPDSLGGLIYPTNNYQIERIDGITGQPDWEFSDASAYYGQTQPVANASGTAFMERDTGVTCCSHNDIVGLDVLTGQLKFVVPIPQSFGWLTLNGQVYGGSGVDSSPIGPLTTMPDGSTVTEVFSSSNVADETCGQGGGIACSWTINWNGSLNLLTIHPDGTSSTQVVDSNSQSASVIGPDSLPYLPCGSDLYGLGETIPDGSGGSLVSWSKADVCASQASYKMTHIAGNSTTTYSLPYCILDDLMVLGDNNTVFASDNSCYDTNEPVIFAFDLNSGAVKWTYQQPVDQITLIAASQGGGVVAKSTLSGVDTILRFDASGNVTQDTWSASNINNFGGSFWQGEAPSNATVSGLEADSIVLSDSPYDSTDGVGGSNAAPNLSVSNLSQVGANQTALLGGLNEVFQALAVPTFSGSSTCFNWLNTGQNNVAALQGYVDPNHWAHGTINDGGNVAYTTFAWTQIVSLSSFSTIVNDISGFFNYQYPEGGRFQPLTVGTRGYEGNTLPAQEQISIHELGHQAQFIVPPNAPSGAWQQNDAGKPRLVDTNERIVDRNCGQMIRALPRINPTINVPPDLSAGLSPISGSVGSQITIRGSNFGSPQGTGTVSFNSLNGPIIATVNSWGSSQITVTVPNGAITGNVVVTVSGVSTTGPIFTIQ